MHQITYESLFSWNPFQGEGKLIRAKSDWSIRSGDENFPFLLLNPFDASVRHVFVWAKTHVFVWAKTHMMF